MLASVAKDKMWSLPKSPRSFDKQRTESILSFANFLLRIIHHSYELKSIPEETIRVKKTANKIEMHHLPIH